MKHLKKFENFSINELQDWATMPVDVNKGLGDMMNKFYSEFPELVAEVKQHLGNKFTVFKQNLEDLVDKISNLDKSTLDKLGEDIKSFFGTNVDKKQMQAKVENLVNQELRKEGLIGESKMNEWSLFGKKPKIEPGITMSGVKIPEAKNVLKNVFSKIFTRSFLYLTIFITMIIDIIFGALSLVIGSTVGLVASLMVFIACFLIVMLGSMLAGDYEGATIWWRR